MRPRPSIEFSTIRLTSWLVVFVLAVSGVASAESPPPARPDPGWLAAVEARIALEEYEVTWQDHTYVPDVEAAWHAPNRAHGFRTYFTGEGPRLIPRSYAGEVDGVMPAWEWGLSLAGYGRGGDTATVAEPRLRASGHRVDYERGALTEWYDNSSRGLEQGFKLWSRPEEAEGTDVLPVGAPLGPRTAPVEPAVRARLVHVDLRLLGTLEPVIATDGQAVDFRTGSGVKVIHYAELKVIDARGRELPAWIEGFTGAGFGGLRIVFDDANAAWPVTIDPLATSPAWTAEADQENAHFGLSVATAGDVNGDGYADVIVGAYSYDNGETDEGRVFVYHGSSSGLAASPSWTAESDQANAYFGVSVGTAGDVNGDGYADVIVGAHYYDNGEVNEGRAFVYHGSSSGLAGTSAWTAESDQGAAQFGFSVATAGDVDGDGYADVIVGAYVYDNGEVNEGRAFVYYGNDGPGLSLRPEQRRADGTAPIAKEGATRSSDGFRLAVIGRTPFGRGRVRLECEVKAGRAAFDGAGTTSGTAWADTGATGVDLEERVSGLEPGVYHWRVRLLYDPAASPFQQASRWFTIPWGGWRETDLGNSSFIGGLSWEDRDGDGIRQTDEPLLGGIQAQLLDSTSSVVDSAVTASDGTYRFEVDRSSTYRVRFLLPTGYAFTLQDQGADDTLDSDADPVSGETADIVPPHETFDADGWSAGLRKTGPCYTPDEEVYIATVRQDANDNTVLDIQDPNQPDAVTGYNIYRSDTASLPPQEWPLLATDVVDEDAGTPNVQWTDTTGDVSPTGVWYYEASAYNNACDAEGPR